jgi:hypothetical protein
MSLRWIAQYLIDDGYGGVRMTTRVVLAATLVEAKALAAERGPEGDFILTVRAETPEEYLGQSRADIEGQLKGIKRWIDDAS